MTRRHPQDTAPPRGRPAQQSPWHSDTHARRPAATPRHSATHATRPAAIPMAQRHQATRPAAIPMAQRHTRDTPDAHRHSLPLRSTAQRRTPDTPDAACRCVPRKVRSKLTSTNPQIPCACHDFATPNARPHTRFASQGHEIQRF